MKYLFHKTVLVIVLFISPFTLNAQTDDEVCQWVKQILTSTLSVDYNFQPSDEDEIRTNFTANAWNALTQFLGGYIKTIKTEQLTLHPTVIKEPFIAESGTVSGIRYWRVNEVISIPELNLMIAFSLIVEHTSGFKNNQFLIQSMDMVKKEN